MGSVELPENGYVPGLGAKDTHALAKFFGGKVGKPKRVYLTGHSMGGQVTGVAIEQWPNTFAGALPMCGVMADNELFDYFQDVYLTAETLVGNVPIVPTPADYQATGGLTTKAALGPAFPAVLTPTGERFKAVIENLTGGDRPTFDEGWLGPYGGSFTFGLGGAGAGRENLTTVYQFDTDPALNPDEQAFNDGIVRLAADPQYRHKNGLGAYRDRTRFRRRSAAISRFPCSRCTRSGSSSSRSTWSRSMPHGPLRMARRTCSSCARSATCCTAASPSRKSRRRSTTWWVGS
ncbi:MAG: prolyl oligopeptidase family serine peptidase [Chloroflexi bacterium]|nr:prolyl oligopeptidase family serine peptidase [Chloroflexota bacterium]MDA1001997.1 prolyl oligopeptidase family serine peptidase [Chloroflexota bacterium]